MLKPIIVVAVCILAFMIAVKDGRVLHAAGLTGSCSAVASLADGEVIEACTPGKLDGRPDLAGRSCSSAGFKDKTEYWRCPANVSSGQGR